MRDRWEGMSRAGRVGLVVALLVVVAVVVLAVVSRLDGSGDDSAVSPTSTPGAPVSPSASPTDGPTSGPVPTGSPTPTTDSDAEPLPEIPHTNDPDEYAVAIAEIVLGLNPRDHARDDFLDLLFGEIRADVSADDRARIEPVIELWLPDEFGWQRQRDYAQVSSFIAESVWVPEIAEDNQGEIPAEFQVRTVAGTQTTEFLDENNKIDSSETPRLLTVITFCPPDGEPCSLFSIPQEVQR